jgi:hypothetical protein
MIASGARVANLGDRYILTLDKNRVARIYQGSELVSRIERISEREIRSKVGTYTEFKGDLVYWDIVDMKVNMVNIGDGKFKTSVARTYSIGDYTVHHEAAMGWVTICKENDWVETANEKNFKGQQKFYDEIGHRVDGITETQNFGLKMYEFRGKPVISMYCFSIKTLNNVGKEVYFVFEDGGDWEVLEDTEWVREAEEAKVTTYEVNWIN